MRTGNLVCKQADTKFWMADNVKDSENWPSAKRELEKDESFTKQNSQKFCNGRKSKMTGGSGAKMKRLSEK